MRPPVCRSLHAPAARSIANVVLLVCLLITLPGWPARAGGGRPSPASADNPARGAVPAMPTASALHLAPLATPVAWPKLPGLGGSPMIGPRLRSMGSGAPAVASPVVARYGALPMSFERNDGQTDRRVSFLARGNGYTLFLTGSGATLALLQPEGAGLRLRSDGRGGDCGRLSASAVPNRACAAALADHRAPWTGAGLGQGMGRTAPPPMRETAVRLQFVGANAHPRIEGVDRLPGIVNYFIGNDPRKWHTRIPAYARVAYKDLYPGISLAFYGHQGSLEYDWVVAPGADPSRIRLAVLGAAGMHLDRQGDLVLGSHGVLLRQVKPLVYQMVGSQKRTVTVNYAFFSHGLVGFALGIYDRHKPLVIDPVLSYSTYLGGNLGYGIAVDSSGSAYVTGYATSSNFPMTPGALQTSDAGGYDTFVAKLNPGGSALVYATYLGGSGLDEGSGIVVDTGGDAYVTGQTESSNFPTTAGAMQFASGGSVDAFVAKLNPSGSILLYSTYLGGSGLDYSFGTAVDGAGNAYVTGATQSCNFPITVGAPHGMRWGWPW